MLIFKIIVIAFITLFVTLLLKQYGRKEYALLTVMVAGIITVLMLLPQLNLLIDTVKELVDLSGVENKYITILIKSLGVSIIAQLSADICRDNNNSSLADKIELSGKLIILILCIPMIKAVADFSLNLIGGKN